MGKFENLSNENKSKKEGRAKTPKIVKLGGTLVLTGAIALTGINIYDRTVNHIEEKCPLCSIIGLQHQANVINNRYQNEGYFAYYQPADPDTKRAVDTIDAIVTRGANGTVTYTIPEGHEGYVLVGNKFVKYVDIAEVKEQVIVLKNDGIICEDGTCELVTSEVNRFMDSDLIKSSSDNIFEIVETTTPTR